MAWLARDSVADAGAFLARVVRLDPDALVRLRPQADGKPRPQVDGKLRPPADGNPWPQVDGEARPHVDGTVVLWGRLPFGVLVSRGVRGDLAEELTVGAAALLKVVESPEVPLPASRPTEWRWPLPGVPGTVVESIPADEILRVGAAAADTVRSASAEGVAGRAVGSRALRDALLDHVPIVVTTGTGERVAIPQRLVQAVLRMGFAPAGSMVRVRVAGGWVGLSASFGNSWFRPPLLLR